MENILGVIFLDVRSNVNKIEKIEMELTIFNSKRALSSSEKKLETIQVGNSILLKDKTSPQSIYYNRVKEFSPTDIDKLDQILEIYEQDQIIPCFDLAPNHLNYDMAKALANKGYFSAEQLAFLQISPEKTKTAQHQFRIVQVTEDNAEELIKLIGLSNGLTYEAELIKQKNEYFFRPNFKNYIAYIGDQPAGMGSLFISGNEGYIANDFTFVDFRGRGLQKALIAHRLQVAKQMDLETVYTDVEFGSASHNNMVKIGFQLVFVNSFWMRDSKS
jgi:predicted GNAT family acetyltransferase